MKSEAECIVQAYVTSVNFRVKRKGKIFFGHTHGIFGENDFFG